MKKILALPLFAMAVLVSQAGAKMMCLYDDGGCWPDTKGTGCEWGWVYNDGKEGAGTYCAGGTYDKPGPGREGTTPPEPGQTAKGCCKWASTGECANVMTDKNAADCQTGANTYWEGAACSAPPDCPTGTPTYDGGSKTSLGCCKWADTETNPQGKCWDVYDSEEVTDCSGGDNQFWSSKCPDGNGTCPGSSPVIKFAHSQALIVAPYGRSLHISSIREATVSLYDMSGVKVYSGKVRAGNSVFGLE